MSHITFASNIAKTTNVFLPLGMIKIALCGAHGTGKTTLLKEIAKLVEVPVLERTIRSFYIKYGVHDFDLLPPDVRTVFQKRLLMNQIQREDFEGKDGFLTDRSVIDYWGYTECESDMSDVDKAIFKEIIVQRAKLYDAIIYCPVEFDAENEYLRADVTTRERVDTAIITLIDNLPQSNIVRVRGDVLTRLHTVKGFLNI